MIIPLTTQLIRLKNKFVLEVKYSDKNGLKQNSAVLIPQMRALDMRFFENKIGELNKEDLDLIDNKIKEFLELK
jgi:mRNA-degrading endonuclease toxin of MazEF toxin-antitoxin module